jgi:hypothetical protein
MYNRIAHAFAGSLVLISIILTHLTDNKNWLWIAAFVGINLLQNSMTNWCLLHQILKKIGVKNTESSCEI